MCIIHIHINVLRMGGTPSSKTRAGFIRATASRRGGGIKQNARDSFGPLLRKGGGEIGNYSGGVPNSFTKARRNDLGHCFAIQGGPECKLARG